MEPREAKTRFLKRLESAGRSLATLTPAEGIDYMLAYYADERADGCDLGADGDMMLFAWGTYDWGDGPAFEVNITRQLIITNDEEDEPLQLRLSFRFEPAAGAGTGDRNWRWCSSPEELPEFRRFVARSAATKVVGKASPNSVELLYERT
jgi:hypothetical protein